MPQTLFAVVSVDHHVPPYPAQRSEAANINHAQACDVDSYAAIDLEVEPSLTSSFSRLPFASFLLKDLRRTFACRQHDL